VDLRDVQVVFSHPQSLAQCQIFLGKSLGNAQQYASMSNSTAVVDMKASGVPSAAIAPRRAAELYGVRIVEEGIQDRSNNMTKFVVISRSWSKPTGSDKTLLYFTYKQHEERKPRKLYEALGAFAERDVNLTKIESRPTKDLLGQYVFLLECEGHSDDRVVQEAITDLMGQPGIKIVRALGSYPRWEEESNTREEVSSIGSSNGIKTSAS